MMLDHDGRIFRGFQYHIFPKQQYPRLLSGKQISLSSEMRADCIIFSKRHVQRQQSGLSMHARAAMRVMRVMRDACDA